MSVLMYNITDMATDESMGPKDEVTAPGDIAKSSSTLRPKEKRTLWIGDLDRAEGIVDEAYVHTHMFYEFAAYITGVRICRDRTTRQPSFGFVEFVSQKEAQYVLEHMNGRFVPGRYHKYKLNWASFNLTDKPESKTTFSKPAQINAVKVEDGWVENPKDQNARRSSNARSAACPVDSISVWVGSLDPHTCREEVEDLFEKHYSSVCFVKLIMDQNTGHCKGFGFVHFRDADEAERCLEEMNGAICRGRRIRVNRSNTSRLGPHGQPLQSALSKLYAASAAQAQTMANEYCGGFVPTQREKGILSNGHGARVLVRGLDSCCLEDELLRHFTPFGEVLHCKLMGGGRAHITFAEPAAAINSIRCMDGAAVGAQRVAVEMSAWATGDTCQRAETTGWLPMTNLPGQNTHQRTLPSNKHTTAYPLVVHYPYPYYIGMYDQGQVVGEGGISGIQGATPDTELKDEGEPISLGGITVMDESAFHTKWSEAGGIFLDIDPSLVPPELLDPRKFHNTNSNSKKRSMETQVHFVYNPCHLQLHTGAIRFSIQQVDDEFLDCKAVLRGACRKRIKEERERQEYDSSECADHLYCTPIDAIFQMI